MGYQCTGIFPRLSNKPLKSRSLSKNNYVIIKLILVVTGKKNSVKAVGSLKLIILNDSE